ncbi:MAG: PAS domain S-box protein [Candidatus Aminicenantales bacterium]
MEDRRKKLKTEKNTIGRTERSGLNPEKPLKIEQERTMHAQHETQKWFRANLYSIGDAVVTTDREGRVRQMNPTHRKRAEETLRESEEKYRQIVSTSTDAIIIFEAKAKNFVEVNKAAESLYGYSREEFLKMNILTITGEEKKTKESFEKVPRGELDLVPVRYHKKKDGTVFPVEISASQFKVRDRTFVCGVVRDITERKRAEKTLQESEEKYRHLFEEALDAILVASAETGIIIDCNRAATLLWGREKSELVGQHQRTLHPPEEIEGGFSWTFQQHLREKEGQVLEAQIVTKNGEIRGVEIMANVFELGGRRLIQGIFHDITERKRAEEALRVSEQRLKEAQRLGRIGHWEFDLETRQIYWSDMVFAIYERDPKLGPPTEEEEAAYYSPEDAKKLRDCAQTTIETGEPYEIDVSLRLPGGKFVNVVAIGTPIKDSRGRITRLMGTVQDITERKRTENQIRSLLNDKEVMLREIHHRVKNNLQIISSLLNLQARQVKNKKLQALFRESQSRIKSMALVHESFYKSKDMSHIDLSIYIEKITTHLLAFFKADAKAIRLRMDTEPIEIDINRAIPCGLILNELISNSLQHAFPGNQEGEITVSLRTRESGKYLLSVKDSGIGFPEDLDFRNTESLGMQIVMNLINQIEGSIEFHREQGTEFIIMF